MRNPPPLTHIEKSAHPGVNLMTSNLISNLGWRQILLRSHTLWQTHQSLAAFLPILNSETKIIIIRKQSKEHRITGNHNVSFNNLYWKRIWIRSYGKPKQCFKSTDIILPTKLAIVKAMFFPVVMYRYESWTMKKAEQWRIDVFQLWCWRRQSWVLFGQQGDQTSQS